MRADAQGRGPLSGLGSRVFVESSRRRRRPASPRHAGLSRRGRFLRHRRLELLVPRRTASAVSRELELFGTARHKVSANRLRKRTLQDSSSLKYPIPNDRDWSIRGRVKQEVRVHGDATGTFKSSSWLRRGLATLLKSLGGRSPKPSCRPTIVDFTNKLQQCRLEVGCSQ